MDKFGIPVPKYASNKLRWPGGSERKEEDDLFAVKAKNDIYFFKHVGVITLLCLWFFVILFLACILVLFFHYIAPQANADSSLPNWFRPWLSAEQLTNLKSMLFSGTMGAIISSAARTQIEKAAGVKKET